MIAHNYWDICNIQTIEILIEILFQFKYLVGGIPTPLKNMKVRWDDDIPNIWKVIKFMFQTTNQISTVAHWLDIEYKNYYSHLYPTKVDPNTTLFPGFPFTYWWLKSINPNHWDIHYQPVMVSNGYIVVIDNGSIPGLYHYHYHSHYMFNPKLSSTLIYHIYIYLCIYIYV